jgi:transcriptional antiterminator RfaH
MLYFAPGWYIIYTKPKNEKKLAERLSAREINCFLPLVKVVKNWHDRKKILLEPAFPSYMFVNLKKLSDYFDALNTDGAVTYVKAGQQPSIVRQHVIDQIKTVIHQDNVQVVSENIEAGMTRVITEGPFAGLDCEIVRRNGNNKILVRVNMLNRSIIADLPATFFSTCTTVSA